MSVYVSSFIAGMVSFLSPCIIPMITVYFSMITGVPAGELNRIEKSKAAGFRIIVSTLIFIAAFTVVFTAAGAASGSISGFLKGNTALFNVTGGIFVVFLALKSLGLFKNVSLKIKGTDRLIDIVEDRAATGYIKTFLTGLFFAIACSHCIGPLLFSMLIFAGNTGSAYTGMLVMLAFSAGLGVPYFLTGTAVGKSVVIIRKLQKYQRVISCITGMILLIFGILLLLNKFTLIVEVLYRIIPYKIPTGM